jgi:uncharacterized RDD family membrane protein YckC
LKHRYDPFPISIMTRRPRGRQAFPVMLSSRAMPPDAGEEAILGLDNVALRLPIAGAASRSLAAFVDYLIVTVLAFAMFALFGFTAVFAGLGSRTGAGWLIALAILGYFVLEYGFFAGFELYTRGQTPGKMTLHLRVVSAQGGRPSAAAILVRNAVRSIDVLVGVPLMALDPSARRLGDRLAGTLVLHTRSREPELVVRRLPSGWGPREAAVLEEFLRRAPHLETPRAEAMAQKLLQAIERADPAYLASSPAEQGPVERLRLAATAE